MSNVHKPCCTLHSILNKKICSSNELKYIMKAFLRSGNCAVKEVIKISDTGLVDVQDLKPVCCWWLIWPIQNDAKKVMHEKWLKPCHVAWCWYSSESIQRELPQWIPTWQGLNGFQRFLCSCALDESSVSIGRVSNPRCMWSILAGLTPY